MEGQEGGVKNLSEQVVINLKVSRSKQEIHKYWMTLTYTTYREMRLRYEIGICNIIFISSQQILTIRNGHFIQFLGSK